MSFSFKDCRVEFSTNGTTWTDVRAHAAAVDVGGGDRQTGEAYPFSSDTPTLGYGKREPREVKVRFIYTEGTAESFEIARSAYESGGSFFVRWSPRGGTSGQAQYTTSSGVITSFQYPGGEAGSGDIVMAEITVRCAAITRSLVA